MAVLFSHLAAWEFFGGKMWLVKSLKHDVIQHLTLFNPMPIYEKCLNYLADLINGIQNVRSACYHLQVENCKW